MLHVRTIIAKLDHELLVQKSIIPDLKPFISKEAGTSKKCPIWVYRELKDAVGSDNFSFFGYYMDRIVRKMISDHVPVIWNENPDSTNKRLINLLDPEKKWNNIAYESIELTASSIGIPPEKIKIPTKTFSRTYGMMGAINKSIGVMFSQSAASRIEFNSEFIVKLQDGKGIQGHPDVIGINMVLDIKTTQNFNNMANESFLQILSYVAIMRHNGRTVNYTGILLPLQTTLILVDISKWDSQQFLNILLEEVKMSCSFDTEPNYISQIECINCISYVGQTLSKTLKVPASVQGGKPKNKKVTLSEALNNYVNKILLKGENLKPAQIFLNGNCALNLKITNDEIINVAQLINNTELRLYVHAPYTINLSRPITSKNPTDKEFVLVAVEQHLDVSSCIGCRGVVFHVGKSVSGMTQSEGLDKMEESIRRVISHATIACPFLLETPVGAGCEVAWQVGEFINFYDRFTSEEKKRLKICIDTCHVWAAGYEPIEYIKRWEAKHGSSSVGLIHFNDSKNKKGSRVDRHAYCGTGHIGLIKMVLVAQWALNNGIDMVFE